MAICRSFARSYLLRRYLSPTTSLARYWCGSCLKASPAVVLLRPRGHVVGDAAGHAYRGMTRRNRSLFLERGHAYIYLAYGRSYLLNVSSEMPRDGDGSRA